MTIKEIYNGQVRLCSRQTVIAIMVRRARNEKALNVNKMVRKYLSDWHV